MGFLATRPGRFGPAEAFGPTDIRATRPGSGIKDERRVPESDVGVAGSLPFDEAAIAESTTSFKKLFFVTWTKAMCSSGTVSRFFSKNPSAS